MRFNVRSYRNGLQILRASPAYDDIVSVLTSIPLAEVEKLRDSRQARYGERAKAEGGPETKAGIQKGLNITIRDRLEARGWTKEVPVFEPDARTEKGTWTIDFVKRFAKPPIGVGVEVTFNHAEALPWTPLRLTLAHEAENVLPDAEINVGCIIIGTDNLKGSKKAGSLRMDSAVGTFERLVTLLPKIRPLFPAPLVIFGLDWSNGGLAGEPTEIELHGSKVRARPLLFGET